jgi:hypothetical protein
MPPIIDASGICATIDERPTLSARSGVCREARVSKTLFNPVRKTL